MKRSLLTMLLILTCGFCSAQVSLEQVIERLDSNRIRAEFSCKYTSGGNTFSYKGKITAQGKCFVSNINGVETFCNGDRLVVVDREAKEAYIEDATGLDDFFRSNIGNISELRFSELRFLDLSEDMSVFNFATKSLSSDWSVTDLRE